MSTMSNVFTSLLVALILEKGCFLLLPWLENPFFDAMFIFSNRTRKSIKVLHWCINGFEFYTKTASDKSKYQWPNNENEQR